MSKSPTPVDGLPGTTRDLAGNLVLASRMITAAHDYNDMAMGVLHTIAQQMTAAGITLLHASAEGSIQSRSVAALVTVEGPVTVDPLPRTDLLPTPAQIGILLRGLPITPNIDDAGDMTLQELAPRDLTWAASFALRMDDQVLGTLDIFHTRPCKLTAEETDAFAMLADQIAAATRQRHLLGQTQSALDQTRTLYEINRAILGAQDTLDILRTLRQHFEPDALLVSHFSATYDSNSRIQDVTIDFMSLLNDEQVTAIRLSDFLSASAVAQLNDTWNSGSETVSFVEDLDAPGINDPLVELAHQYNLRSYALVSLREGGLVREAIGIGFDKPQVFDERRQRLYQAIADQISIVLQNYRLLHEAQVSASEYSRQVRLLQIINQLATTISSSQDEKTLLDTSCRALVEATGLDHSSIALVTPAATASQVLSEHPLRGTVGVQIPLADNAAYETLRTTRQPLIITDVDGDTSLPAAYKHLLQRAGVRALVMIPLITVDRLVGSISVDVYTTEKPITPEIVDTALSVAAQVELGIQNIRLLAEAQRRAEQLQRITAFSQSVQATLDLPTIFNNMLAESVQMLPQDRMSIGLYDASRDALRVVAEHSGGQTQVNADGGELIPISGHIATAWNNREMLHIPDLFKLRDHSDADSDIRDWMVAPIMVHGRMLGLVNVGSIRPYAYSDTDEALFQQMVTQLAVAIENVEAYTQSQRMVKNESLLNTISTQLQNQMNIEQMMDITAHELGKALGARRARIRFGSPDGSS